MINLKTLEMKNIKIIAMVVALLAAGGITYYDLEKDMPVHPTKTYRIRSIDKPLNIYLHHTAIEGDTIIREGNESFIYDKKNLQRIAKYHIKGHNWAGIAYHFAINKNGDVYQLNDLTTLSYHTKNKNTLGIGIVFLGNYETKPLPLKAVKAGEVLIDALCQTLDIKSVKLHKQVVNTLCPGKYASEELQYLLF